MASSVVCKTGSGLVGFVWRALSICSLYSRELRRGDRRRQCMHGGSDSISSIQNSIPRFCRRPPMHETGSPTARLREVDGAGQQTLCLCFTCLALDSFRTALWDVAPSNVPWCARTSSSDSHMYPPCHSHPTVTQCPSDRRRRTSTHARRANVSAHDDRYRPSWRARAAVHSTPLTMTALPSSH